ncbi:hypothetical protein NDU88_002025 [Pleurodeles waltl]|uniref:Reverse transcriptase RNase H-like domain-containing protein n=1 Tax=Pleurodeles waltl TaxID=8319 RepID=A0AAV7TK19_PLEWA|nr:hypothetical protein NDU88_002025 [Pleurodeles waltl]
MTADTRRAFAYSFPYQTPFYNVPVSFGNRNAGKVFIWQSKRDASSRTRLKAFPYEGNTSCDLFRTVVGVDQSGKFSFQGGFDHLEYSTLTADASGKGLGVVLKQTTDECIERTIVFAPTEENISEIEKEMHPAVWGMEKFRHYP